MEPGPRDHPHRKRTFSTLGKRAAHDDFQPLRLAAVCPRGRHRRCRHPGTRGPDTLAGVAPPFHLRVPCRGSRRLAAAAGARPGRAGPDGPAAAACSCPRRTNMPCCPFFLSPAASSSGSDTGTTPQSPPWPGARPSSANWPMPCPRSSGSPSPTDTTNSSTSAGTTSSAASRGRPPGMAGTCRCNPEDRPQAIERWKRSLATGEDYEIEYRFRSASGEYRWFLGRALAGARRVGPHSSAGSAPVPTSTR